MSTPELNKALVKFHGALEGNIKKQSQAHQYKYADLGSTLDVIREPLAAAELAVTQTTACYRDTSPPTSVLITTLLHSSGEEISSAFGFVFTISLMFNQFQDSYNKSLQLIHFCGIGLGIVIGTSVIWVISVIGNLWNDQWIVIGIIGIILCIPIIMFTPKNLDVLNSKSIPIKVKLKANFITISFGYFFFGIGYIIFGTFISAMVKSSFESSFFQYFSWVIVGLFAIPSVIIWDWVAKKISRDLLLFFSCSTVTLGISFLFFGKNLFFLLISCVLYGLGVPGSVALVLVEGKKRFIGSINVSIAIMTTTFSIGQIFGPYISGIIIDFENNYYSSILLAMVCMIISSFLMLNFLPL